MSSNLLRLSKAHQRFCYTCHIGASGHSLGCFVVGVPPPTNVHSILTTNQFNSLINLCRPFQMENLLSAWVKETVAQLNRAKEAVWVLLLLFVASLSEITCKHLQSLGFLSKCAYLSASFI